MAAADPTNGHVDANINGPVNGHPVGQPAASPLKTTDPEALTHFEESLSGLTAKQRLFVSFYLSETKGVPLRAAKMAGVACPEAAAYLMLENVRVKAAIEAGYSAALKPDQIVARLSEFAEADMGDFLSVDPATGKAEVDLTRALRRGKTHLIKRVVPTKYGTTVELHDQVASLKLLGQYQGMWKDVTEQDITVRQADNTEEVLARIRRIRDEQLAKNAQPALGAP